MQFKRIRVLVPALLLAAMVNSGSAELSGLAAPDFVLKSVSGRNLRLSEYRGRVVLLGFWASWCGECRSQLEGLADLYARYEGAGFDLLTVNLDRDQHDAGDTVAAMKIDFPVLHDPGGAVGEQYDVQSLPYVLLIDRDGVVREEFVGYRSGNEDQYLERVRVLLGE